MNNRWFALFSRYVSVFKAVWKQRFSLDSPKRMTHESAFLPAALALQETPVSPLPRILAYLLISFALIALIWSIFGQIEIVAVAQGKIIATGHTKVIQPLETSTVKAIYVIDGQAVKAGDPLIDLDATQSAADLSRVTEDLLTARLEAARAQAFLDIVQRRKAASLSVVGADAEHLQQIRLRLESDLAEYHAKLSKLDAEILQHQSEIQTTQALIAKLEQTLPIAKQQAGDYQSLLDNNYVSKHGYLEKEQAMLEQQGDLAAQQSRLKEINSAIETAKRERTSFVAESARAHFDALSDAQVKIGQLTQEKRKNDQRNRLMRLTAPVDGVVQQLVIHTIGGVVTPAQALLAVVPRENAAEIEANVENKDIGFVTAGQEATVKLETFPYTKYGTIEGKVTFVSNDAANDEKKGLIYPVRILLAKSQMRIDNKLVNLSPGMAATVEVKIGKRRVIEYFLSPLLQYANESLRER
ncbi:HlyD family type I secretion periplasmic adaptor subunit [Methyloradius palustris]|uniref:Membrane fusion protein (MFP) family protein n=1 Tax=Methyloradius palustris TaxID=2778876 RepID=A0A8D5GE35_9PROT|nr:HlyD family type I secretion periplasmic adaptor subunit [Methyloradius palustris]BCM24954.1 HlyD family type I secretion periplasmic adaptor subunit [Methyloradius palustris]